MKKIFKLSLLIICMLGMTGVLHAGAAQPPKKLKAIAKTIKDRDAILIADSQGKVIFSKHAEKKLAPASTLKILTSLAAIHYLGLNYRFKTEFYIDDNFNLKIKGYGDPILVSELLPNICKMIRHNLGTEIRVNDLIADTSYFNPLYVPGVSDSLKPYDAANSALSVNFNTVCFRYTQSGYESGEPQTPLVPFALDKIRNTGIITQKRIPLSSENNEAGIYAGHLFRYFLEKQGVSVNGNVRLGNVKETDTLVLGYVSHVTLEDILERLLESSNNFIANQIFVTIGASVYGAPGTLEKGIVAVSEYAKNFLNIDNIQVVEGSGISRGNRLSAADMLKVLDKFKKYQYLMRHEDRVFYKTGTLSDVSTRAGYIKDDTGQQYSFVIFYNTPGKLAKPIMAKLVKTLK